MVLTPRAGGKSDRSQSVGRALTVTDQPLAELEEREAVQLGATAVQAECRPAQISRCVIRMSDVGVRPSLELPFSPPNDDDVLRRGGRRKSRLKGQADGPGSRFIHYMK